jgi:hypothetical protein
VLKAILSSSGADTDRYEGFSAFREDDIVGCFGVVPLLFDRKEEGDCRDAVPEDVAVNIPFVLTSLYSGGD